MAEVAEAALSVSGDLDALLDAYDAHACLLNRVALSEWE